MVQESHIESWTADEVVAFLSTLSLEQYSDDFLENEITGDILIHLEHEALKDIGIDSVGHRITLLRAVYEVKIADNVTMEPDHYVPATAEMEHLATATNVDIAKDLMTITQAIQLRDDKLAAAELEIRRLTENLARLKDQLSPVFKIVKELQPLPTPADTASMSPMSAPPSLSRKFSTKKLFLGSAPRQQSPNHIPPAYNSYPEPESPRSPVKYSDLMNSSRVQTPTLPIVHPPQRDNALMPNSQLPPRLPPPPRPPPPGVTPLNTIREAHAREKDESNAGTPIQTPITSTSLLSSTSTSDPFKSFRVGLEDPCSKVLPAALKKYKINDDWREYSLFICYANEERCLGLDEKPLLVFQELQKQNKSPVFMLRRQESGTTHVMPVRGEHEVRF